MTIEQVARYLQLHKQVVYRHVRKGNIPTSRVGGTLRFKKSVIDRWLVDSALKSLRGAPNETAPLPETPAFDLSVD
ncbi:MAG: helix-turn-helix domain-containing protein [Candidatus Aureabacteria bacterium]|nr:helix-turn-helix domain-containing protein [Candidatus Auribacterota bacterium]